MSDILCVIVYVVLGLATFVGVSYFVDPDEIDGMLLGMASVLWPLTAAVACLIAGCEFAETVAKRISRAGQERRMRLERRNREIKNAEKEAEQWLAGTTK